MFTHSGGPPAPQTAPHSPRVHLDVPYADKDAATALIAKHYRDLR